MKNLCLYTNCQGDGLAHFLRKVPGFNERYEVRVWHNWQVIMQEISPLDLNADAAKADVFIYQHTPAFKYGSRSSEDMVANVIPKGCLPISISYAWNTGFFPIVLHGHWWTGADVEARGRAGQDIYQTFMQDPHSMQYDCMRRFEENLAEQERREQECDVKLVPWIRDNMRRQHMFLLCNHPASPLLAYWARELLKRFAPDLDTEIPIAHPNEANLPGFHTVHPAVVRELGLEYDPPNAGADPHQFEKWMEQLRNELKPR